MATDNRYRPGPPFRCKCGSFYPVITTPIETKVIGRKRAILVECSSCHHSWYSKHRLARVWQSQRGVVRP